MSSVTSAYRKDLERTKRTAFGPDDDAWLMVGSLLEAAADASATDRKRLVSRAAAIARRTPSEAEFRVQAKGEFGAGLTNADTFAVFAIAIDDVGAPELAIAIVDLALDTTTPRPLSRGRLLAQRARFGNKLIWREVSQSLYEEIDRIGRAENLPELHLRTQIGRIALAQIAGNYPRMLTLARQAIRMSANIPIRNLRRRAYNAAVNSAASRSLFDEALEHAWAQMEVARGDASQEVLALQTMGQLMLVIGNVDAARAAFSAVVARSAPAVAMLPSLSGLATAAARANDAKLLDWAVGEVLNAEHMGLGPYSLSAAIIECSVALATAGRKAEAQALAARALDVARANGFHELTFQAEAIDEIAHEPAAPPARLKAAGNEIVRAVCELAPPRLPRHVRMTAGSAS